MATRKCKVYYCKRYGEWADKLCPRSPSNDDDWDELISPCANCSAWQPMEAEMDTFTVTCKKDRYGYKAGDKVDAYINCGILVVGKYMTTLDEFREHFEI